MAFILASEFGGLALALLFIPLLLAGLAATSLFPAKRGSSWIWPILLLPLIGGSVLLLQLVLYADQLSWLMWFLFPLPLAISAFAILQWASNVRRVARGKTKAPSLEDRTFRPRSDSNC